MSHNKYIKAVILQTLSEVMFGLSFIFTKEATTLATPLELLSWRFLIAAILFFILIRLNIFKVSFRGKNIKMALLLGFLHPICYFLCENQGIALTSASESGIIIATVPIFALIFSVLFLKIHPSRNQTAGIFITLAGVLILVLSQGSKPTFNLTGYLLLFGAVIAYSLFAVQSTKTAEFTSIEKAAVMIFSGAFFFTLLAVINGLHRHTLNTFIRLPIDHPSFLYAVLYLGCGSSIIAFSANNYGIEVLGTASSASFASISTLISVLAGVILLNEPFSFPQAAATILIIVGVFITNRHSAVSS